MKELALIYTLLPSCFGVLLPSLHKPLDPAIWSERTRGICVCITSGELDTPQQLFYPPTKTMSPDFLPHLKDAPFHLNRSISQCLELGC